MPVWSPQQEAIFAEFERGQDNFVGRARAGTGKTTTILEGADRAPEDRILIAAFNKGIVAELKKRVGSPSVDVRTLHSLGMKFLRNDWPRAEVDSARGWNIARDVVGGGLRHTVDAVKKLAGIAKNTCAFMPTEAQLIDIAENNDADADDDTIGEGYDTPKLAAAAHEALKLARQPGEAGEEAMDFDDMLWVPIVNDLVRPAYDMSIIDEAQDMNAVQLALAVGACRGRIAVVGDDRQAIYGFRGADSNAIDRLKGELHAKELPLTVTYRCPQTIVTYAQRLVPDFQAAPSAPAGAIDFLASQSLTMQAQPGDFVLSRTNAPLIHFCWSLLLKGIPARVQGKDIGARLRRLVEKKLRAKDLHDLEHGLEVWRADEVRKALAKEDEARADLANDSAEILKALIGDSENITELLQRLDRLFGDNGAAAVVCSTVHKAKGLEAGRVFLLQDTLYRWKGSKFDREEQNIEYVAITRAKERLTLVSGTTS